MSHSGEQRHDRFARCYDADIAPIWGEPFRRSLARDLELPAKAQVLDVACHTGATVLDLLTILPPGGRIIAIDPRAPMLDVARRKVSSLGTLDDKSVFFRTESIVRLAFANDVYDTVISNLGLHEHPDPRGFLHELARVCKPGGDIRCSVPLRTTFCELHDLMREVLIHRDDRAALQRLSRYIDSYPTEDQLLQWCQELGLDARLVIHPYVLVFRSAREFFYAPVIEYGPLHAWKRIAGEGDAIPEVFGKLKHAIDTYYGASPFVVTVRAATLLAQKVAPTPPSATENSFEEQGTQGNDATIAALESSFHDLMTGDIQPDD